MLRLFSVQRLKNQSMCILYVLSAIGLTSRAMTEGKESVPKNIIWVLSPTHMGSGLFPVTHQLWHTRYLSFLNHGFLIFKPTGRIVAGLKENAASSCRTVLDKCWNFETVFY